MDTRKELDESNSGLAQACSSFESLVASLDIVLNNGELERAMPLIEALNAQSLVLYRDYLSMAVEKAESGDSTEAPFDLPPA